MLDAANSSFHACLHTRANSWSHVSDLARVALSSTKKYLIPTRRNLSLGAPDALQQTVSLRQSVQGVIALAHGTDEAAQGVDVVLAGDRAAVLVDLGDGNLDGTVVLGLDDPVGGAALAGDVAGNEE